MLLIAVNIGVFVWQVQFPIDQELERAGLTGGVGQSSVEFGASASRLTHPGDGSCSLAGGEIACDADAAGVPLDQADWWVTVLASMFMSGTVLQLGLNALFLWIFGKSVEERLGRPRFLLFYLCAGIAAAYAQVLIDTGSTTPVIGASGAIAALIGAHALLYPRAAVLCFVVLPLWSTFVEARAMIVGAAWFALQLVPILGHPAISGLAEDPGVPWGLLAGGLGFGLVAIRPFAAGRAALAAEREPVY